MCADPIVPRSPLAGASANRLARRTVIVSQAFHSPTAEFLPPPDGQAQT